MFFNIIFPILGCVAHVHSCATLQHVDVAIIGGGLSGLAAAKDLAKEGKTFAVLEARNRVGGRVLNLNLTRGDVEELGAEFIGPTQDRVLALAEELGIETYYTYNDGDSILHYQNQSAKYSTLTSPFGLPPVDDKVLEELGQFIAQIDQWTGEINVSAPWTHPMADYWDSITLDSYARQNLTQAESLFFMQTATTTIFSAEMKELSLLYTLSYVASAGNETLPGTFERLIGTKDGAQESRVYGGTQLLAIKLAAKLGSENIRLNTAVRKITLQGDVYLIEADDLSLTATKVVVAMSPPMASRIIYHPLLSAGRDQLTQRMPMGAVGKGLAFYRTPWWRDAGLNAQAISDSGVIHSTFDNTPPSNDFGALMGFIEGDSMRRLDNLSEDEAKDLVAQSFMDIFGPAARNYTSIFIQRWDEEEFSRGGYVANAGPGVLTQYGPYLTLPNGGIHFAGTETADYWKGYMDGAIRSGERAAAEILAIL